MRPRPLLGGRELGTSRWGGVPAAMTEPHSPTTSRSQQAVTIVQVPVGPSRREVVADVMPR
jgi:hypothetical protein